MLDSQLTHPYFVNVLTLGLHLTCKESPWELVRVWCHSYYSPNTNLSMTTIKDSLFNRDLIPSWEGVIQHTLLWLWLLTLTIVNHPMKLWKQINIYHLFNNYVRHKYSRVDSLGTSLFHLITHIEFFLI